MKKYSEFQQLKVVVMRLKCSRKNSNTITLNLGSLKLKVICVWWSCAEIASRHHVEQITQVIDEALASRKRRWMKHEMPSRGGDVWSRTCRSPSRQVSAKALKHNLGKTWCSRTTWQDTFYANQLGPLQFRCWRIVSGVYKDTMYMQRWQSPKLSGNRNDAAGKAYDKIDRILNLPYLIGKEDG